ncbi:hypothetical protein H4582DRAFT_2034135 [Lactarius indigo]|nr:hypothetical protein H4582DRAFT_2034135 [Lactarius indigo]
MISRNEDSVDSFTKSIEILFKVNKVDYIIKVTASSQYHLRADRRRRRVYHGSEEHYDCDRIVSSTGALSLQKVIERVVVIDGSTVRLEMGRVWSRPRSLAA